MKNKEILSGHDVAKSSWSDANLTGLKWENDGRDLILNWARNGKSIGVLKCTWARKLKINITMGENEGGYLLTWGANINSVSDTGWILSFDFASKGEIELTCNEIFLEISG